jgi:hypothetical protein
MTTHTLHLTPELQQPLWLPEQLCAPYPTGDVD